MKQYSFHLFFQTLALGVLLVWATGMSAQTTYPMDTIQGKAYYRYPVQRGEGLYRISVNFSVSQEEIIRHNPVLKTEGLKLGQTLLIPVVERIDTTQYVRHTLAPKETLYGLSRQYGVSVDELRRLNPEVSATMRVGEVLIIKKGVPVLVAPKAEPKIEHEIEPEREPETMPQDQPSNSNEVLALHPDSLPLRLCFLLPFCADQVDREMNMDKFVVFYEGALLAIQDATQRGQRLEVYVFDTGKGDVRLSQILLKPVLSTMDMIIGPAYPSQVEVMAPYIRERQILCLIPFTQKIPDIHSNPYFFQFNPTVSTGKKAVLFKEDGDWSEFEQRFRRYFHVNLFENQNYRYDLLGYDLLNYAIRGLLLSRGAEDELDRQLIWETPYEGLQTSLRFLKDGPTGGYINQPITIIDKKL